MTTPKTKPKPINSLFQHSVHAWRNTTLDDLEKLINQEEEGKDQLKKTDMWGNIPVMWALRYQARDDVIAKMIEYYPKCVKVKNHKNMFAITYAHEYNASRAIIELLKFPEKAQEFEMPRDMYADLDDQFYDLGNDTNA